MRTRAYALVGALGLAAATSLPSLPASAATSDPVVIVAGTVASQPVADVFYSGLAARLQSDGYRTYIFGLPGGGLGDIADTAGDLAGFVEGVRQATGAARVDLVGHSQGGLVSRYYVKNLGGAATVDSLISLGTPHYGTALANLATFIGLGDCLGITACAQMAAGSAFLDGLNAGDDTIGNVAYTNIVTIQDELVIPYWNGHLANDGNNVNVTVQSQCWLRVVGHLGLALDGTVYDGIRDGLRHEPIRLNCFAL